jgi:hypothetical protein
METEKWIVVPVAGFSRKIGFYLSSLENARFGTRRIIEDLSQSEIARKVLPNMNSIGAIVLPCSKLSSELQKSRTHLSPLI